MNKTAIPLAALRKVVFVVSFAFGLPCAHVFAQGVTTASLTGIVTSDKGDLLPGANVVVVHEPTGPDMELP